MTASSDPNEYKYSGNSIAFDAREIFSLSDDRAFGQKAIMFGADMSLSVPDDNKKWYFNS